MTSAYGFDSSNLHANSITPSTSDVATVIRKGLEVSENILPSVAFTNNGLTIGWMTSGPRAQELTYTVGQLIGTRP